MRVMLIAKMCTEKANSAARAGTLASTIQSILADLKPEAVYFSDADGKRTGYIICNITDASQIPAIAEPWFLAFNAQIEINIVMVPEDLGKAAPSIEAAAKKFGR